MKHIRLFESFIDDIFPRGKGPKKEYVKPIEIIAEALAEASSDLLRGDDRSKALALMIADTARLLEYNPGDLQKIFVLVQGEMDSLGKIAEITYKLDSEFIPEGLDPQGFIKFRELFSVMLNQPEEVAASLGIPSVTVVYSTGLLLYSLFISLFDTDMFNKMNLFFGND
jgi:hypothetical protein